MHRAGAASWRITVDVGKGLNAACYVRDAGGLPIGNDPSIPPRLMDVKLGDASPVAADAAPGWQRWWTELVSGARGVQRTGWSPSDEVLGASPAFAQIVGALFDESAKWSDGLARRHPAPHLAPFAPTEHQRRRYELDRAVAEEVIRDYAVTPERVQARIQLIWCAGSWAHQPWPGLLLCSLATWSDEDQFRPALKETFERGLARQVNAG
jgi:hypothetical protein